MRTSETCRETVVTTLEAIEAEVERLAAEIDAPTAYLPTYGRSEDAARPHIEVTGDGGLHWVVVERGHEFERRTTLDRRELLYWIFVAVTSQMASDFELIHRRPDEDFRRLMFTHELGLLETLDEAWRTRRALELEPYLREVGLDHFVP